MSFENENPILICSMEGEANSAGNEPINEERYVKSHSINFTANIFRMLLGIAKEKKGRAQVFQPVKSHHKLQKAHHLQRRKV